MRVDLTIDNYGGLSETELPGNSRIYRRGINYYTGTANLLLI